MNQYIVLRGPPNFSKWSTNLKSLGTTALAAFSALVQKDGNYFTIFIPETDEGEEKSENPKWTNHDDDRGHSFCLPQVSISSTIY